MFLTAWPWFMDLGSMVFLSLVLVLAFRLIVLIFILTVAASFRVFNSRVAFAAFVLYVFSIIICFTPTERLQASRRTLMRYHNFCGFYYVPGGTLCVVLLCLVLVRAVLFGVVLQMFIV